MLRWAATLQQETDRLKIARDADIITEEQYAKKSRMRCMRRLPPKFQEEKEEAGNGIPGSKKRSAKREQAMAAATEEDHFDEFNCRVSTR